MEVIAVVPLAALGLEDTRARAALLRCAARDLTAQDLAGLGAELQHARLVGRGALIYPHFLTLNGKLRKPGKKS